MPGQANEVIDRHNKSIEIDGILKRKRFQLVIKRGFDILASLIGLMILLPVFIIIAFVIKLDSKGPVFFKQTRVCINSERFKIYKFRTMVQDAEKTGMQITVGSDSRITRSGKILRNTKIDELPQLINVLKGDMSFVGPRPEVPKYVKLYDENQKSILKVRPGITDIASIEYRDESLLLANSDNPEKLYIEEIMPKKIELNLIYINKMSILYDILLIIKTIIKIIR